MIKLNTIYNEDCLDTMKRLHDGTIDLIVTSPPYDNLRTYKGFVFNFENIARQLTRITKPGGIIVWVVGDETKNFCESLTSFKQAIFFVEQCEINLLDTMIYEKDSGPLPHISTKRYSPRFEYMFIFSKGRPGTFNPIKDVPTKRGGGKLVHNVVRRQKDGSIKSQKSYVSQEFQVRSNVWRYNVGWNKDTKDKIALSHPARFPEKLAEDMILSWSNENEIVYDPFMGSGTTAKMAIKHKRRYLGSEVSSEYCDIAEIRLSGIDK